MDTSLDTDVAVVGFDFSGDDMLRGELRALISRARASRCHRYGVKTPVRVANNIV